MAQPLEILAIWGEGWGDEPVSPFPLGKKKEGVVAGEGGRGGRWREGQKKGEGER